ncbi:MAG: hypothetical protein U0325_01775 [Polyangiales bacterium]
MRAASWSLSHPFKNAWCHSVCAEPDGTFWVVGSCAYQDAAVFASSRDGGRTWTPSPFAVQKDLARVRGAPDGEVWVSGRLGTLLARRDGVWKRLRVGTKAHLQGLAFAADGRAWVVGVGGLLAHSANRGRTWTVLPTVVEGTLSDVACDARGALVAVGMDEVILRSDDGLAWSVVDAPKPPAPGGARRSLARVVSWAPGCFLAVGDDRVRASTDGGHAWRALDVPNAQDLTSACITADGRWFVGGLNVILRSDDQGATWVTEHAHDGSSHAWVYDLCVTADGQGVAVGPHSTAWLRASG